MSDPIASQLERLDALIQTTPPGPGGPANPELSEQLRRLDELTYDPPEQTSRNAVSDQIRRLDRAVIQTGGAVPTVPLSPRGQPGGTVDMRRRLTEIAQGRTAINPTLLGPENFNSVLTRELSALKETNAGLASAWRQLSLDEGTNVTQALTELTAVANHTPASPTERYSIADRARDDWNSLIATGAFRDPTETLSEVFGRKDILSELPGAPNPEAASRISQGLYHQLVAKLLHTPADQLYNTRRLAERLDPNGPLGDERAAFEALGGAAWLGFLQSREPYYRSLHRHEQILGRRTRPPAQAIGEIPRGPAVTAIDYSPLVPEAHALRARIEQDQDLQATADLMADAELEARSPEHTLMHYNAKQGGFAGILARGAGNVFHWTDQALAGLPSAAFQTFGQAIHKVGIGPGVEQVQADLFKWSLTAGERAEADAEYNFYLQSNPDMNDADRAALARDIYSGSRVARSMGERVEAALGKSWFTTGTTPRSVADLVGATDDGMRAAYDELGSYLDDAPTNLLMLGLMGGAGYRKWSSGRRAAAAARRQHIFEPLDAGDLHDLTAKQVSNAFADTFRRIRDTALRPQQAREFIADTVRLLNDQGLTFTPEITAKVQTAWSLQNRANSRGLFRKTGPVRAEALSGLADSIRPDTIFDSARARADGRIILDPDAPANVTQATLSYLKKVEQGNLAIINGQEGPRGRTLATRAAAAFRAHEAVREAKVKHIKARAVLRIVDEDVHAELDANRKVAAALDADRSSAVSAHNAAIGDALSVALRGEVEGVTVMQARPPSSGKVFRAAEGARASVKTAHDALFPKPDKPMNRRLAQEIGGPDLVRELQDAERTSGREVAAGIFQEAAEHYYTKALEPEPITIPAPEKPRLPALDKIRKRIDEAREAGEPVKLSEQEIGILNRYRPANAALKPRTEKALQAIDRTRERVGKRLEKLTGLEKEVKRYLDKLETEAPGSLKQKPPASLKRAVEERFGEPGSELLYGKRGLVTTDGPGFLSVIEEWREVFRDLQKEERLLRREVIEQGSLALAAMPAHAAQSAMKDASMTALVSQNRYRQLGAALAKEINRNVPIEQLDLVVQSLREGKPHPKLPPDVIGWVQQEFQRLRIEVLGQRLADERLPHSKYVEFAGRDYYPDGYLRELDQVQTQNQAVLRATRDLDVRAPLRLLQIDNNNFKFKRPSDKWHVARRDPHDPTPDYIHREFFDTEAEARKYAEDQTNRGFETDVYAPTPRGVKLAEGLSEDPARDLPEFLKEEALETAKYRLQYTVGLDDRISKPAEVVQRQAEALGLDYADHLRAKVIDLPVEWKPGKTKTHKYLYVPKDSATLPHLRGKWVDAGTAKWLAETIRGMDMFDGIRSAWEKVFDDMPTKIGRQALKWGLQVPNTILSFGAVAVSPYAWAKGWLGNMLYAHLAGASPLNPRAASHHIRYLLELNKDMKGRGSGLWGEGGLTVRKLPEYVQDLIDNDAIHPGENNLAVQLTEATRRFEGVDGLRRRIERLEDELPNVPEADLPRVVTAISKLEDQLTSKVQQFHSEFISQLGARLAAWTQDGVKSVNRRIWPVYTMLGGDTLMKITTYRYLREVKGLSKAEALGEIQGSFQMLHTPSRLQRTVTGPFGSLFMGFKLEQARILGRAVRHNTPRLLSALGIIAATNVSGIFGSGTSWDEFAEAFAAGWGVNRSPFSDAIAAVSGFHLKGGTDGNALRVLGTDDMFGLWGLNSYGWGKRVEELVAGDSVDPTRRAIGSIIGGGAESFALSTAFFSWIGQILMGESTSGETTRSLAGLGKMTSETLFPVTRNLNKAVDILGGQTIDPFTFEQKTSITDHVADKILQLPDRYSSPQRIAAVRRRILRQNGRKTDVQSLELKEDRLLNRFVSSGFDPNIKADLISEGLAERRRQIRLESGEVVPGAEPGPRARKELEEQLTEPVLLRQLGDERLDDLMQIYADWRLSDRKPEPKWEKEFRSVLLEQIESGSAAPEIVLNAIEIANERAASDRLPEDAKGLLRFASLEINRRYFKK